MRIVVVGASGNIGTGFLRRLAAARPSDTVIGIARRIPDHEPPYADVQWHAIDVSEVAATSDLRDVFVGADAVVHLAWKLQPNRHEKIMWDTNVHGLQRVLRAAGDVGVPHVVVVSSVGAYSAGPKSSRASEEWPTGGIHTSHYSRHKAMTERVMDDFETSDPATVITRVRPGLVMNAAAGAQIRRLFLRSWLPLRWLRFQRLPILPFPSRVASQVVHVDDLADLLVRAVERRVGGAFNAAAEPVLDAKHVAALLHARPILMRTAVVRALLSFAWRARLVAMDPGWLDIAANVPIMSTDRARRLLEWQPQIDAREALGEFIHALALDDRQPASPPLNPDLKDRPTA